MYFFTIHSFDWHMLYIYTYDINVQIKVFLKEDVDKQGNMQTLSLKEICFIASIWLLSEESGLLWFYALGCKFEPKVSGKKLSQLKVGVFLQRCSCSVRMLDSQVKLSESISRLSTCINTALHLFGIRFVFNTSLSPTETGCRRIASHSSFCVMSVISTTCQNSFPPIWGVKISCYKTSTYWRRRLWPRWGKYSAELFKSSSVVSVERNRSQLSGSLGKIQELVDESTGPSRKKKDNNPQKAALWTRFSQEACPSSEPLIDTSLNQLGMSCHVSKHKHFILSLAFVNIQPIEIGTNLINMWTPKVKHSPSVVL